MASSKAKNDDFVTVPYTPNTPLAHYLVGTLFIPACGLYYKKHSVLKQVTTSPIKRAPTRRPKPRDIQTPVEPPTPVGVETTAPPSSPPHRTYEPMSEIDHPLLSEGICLPRMGYLRGEGGGYVVVQEEDRGKENIDPEDEMERFFSDVLA